MSHSDPLQHSIEELRSLVYRSFMEHKRQINDLKEQIQNNEVDMPRFKKQNDKIYNLFALVEDLQKQIDQLKLTVKDPKGIKE